MLCYPHKKGSGGIKGPVHPAGRLLIDPVLGTEKRKQTASLMSVTNYWC